jgi:RNA polymerase sigma factor (sigma-70 family)
MKTRVRDDELTRLRPLLAAEAAAEAVPGGIEAADLEQAVWVRLLELREPPADPAVWLRAAVRAEVRRAGRRLRREGRLEPAHAGPTVEQQALDAEQRRALRAAVARLPGRCPELMGAFISGADYTYPEIARELGISQGSLGPLRSRCLGCLRTILNTRVRTAVGPGKAP